MLFLLKRAVRVFGKPFRVKIFRACVCTDGAVSVHLYNCVELVEKLLSVVDYVLLDIKYTNDISYKENVGCSLSSALDFLELLEEKNIKTTIRQVIIPTLNDTEENILKLKEIALSHKCVVKTELLPFKKICQSKYDNMGIGFPLKDTDEPSRAKMEYLNSFLK